MKKPIFLTIFPLATNIELAKEVGYIPYLMFKNHGFDAYVLTYENGNYPILEKELSGLKLKFLSQRFKNQYINILLYILKNYNKIDVIHLFHFSLFQVFIIWIFKILKKNNGKAYIKLDANQTIKKVSYLGLRGYVLSFLIKKVDLISSETKEITEFLNSNNTLKTLVTYIPNGIMLPSQKILISKKSQFLTVGRLDDPGKAVWIQIEAFKQFVLNNRLSDWRFLLVGPYGDEFRNNFDQYLFDNPILKDRINLIGPIYDREKLNLYYAESKIFLFSSLSESFGFVYLEALYGNCDIISTPIPSGIEITDNGRYASFYNFNDSTMLAKLMEERVMVDKILDSQHYVVENFNCKILVDKIYLNLSKYK